MGELRRRRASRSTSGGMGELSERLLDDDSATSASYERHSRSPVSSGREVILHTDYSVDAYLQVLQQRWQEALEALAECLKNILSGQQQEAITDLQIARLSTLKEKLTVPYDGQNLEHQEALRELWRLAFPNIPNKSLKDPQWKEMGWQGPDPGTDFRGAGLFGLQNLLFLGHHHAQAFDALLHKRQGVRADWEYPFAVAGLNITFLLADLLDLQKGRQFPSSVANQTFLTLLEADENAFEEVYCLTFQVLDMCWLEMKASYMDFPKVLKATQAKVLEALKQKPKSLEELKHILLSDIL